MSACPPYLNLVAPAEDGGYVVRNSLISAAVRQALSEGWTAIPCGWHHCRVIQPEPVPCEVAERVVAMMTEGKA